MAPHCVPLVVRAQHLRSSVNSETIMTTVHGRPTCVGQCSIITILFSTDVFKDSIFQGQGQGQGQVLEVSSSWRTALLQFTIAEHASSAATLTGSLVSCERERERERERAENDPVTVTDGQYQRPHVT